MEDLIVCVPFFALPRFPDVCRITGDQDIVVRDILNINTVKKGEYENGPYLEGFNLDDKLDYVFYFKEVGKISEVQHYNNIYILFRAIYKTMENGIHHIVIGYYSLKEINPKEIAPGVYSLSAESAHFVDYRNAPDITDTITGYNLQDYIIKSNSANHPEYKQWNNQWMEQIKDKENKLSEYIERSKLLRVLKHDNNYENKCDGCEYINNSSCPLWKNLLD